MSEIEQLFKQAVKGAQSKKGKFTLSVGTVLKIDNDTCTVDDHEDVRLNAIEDTLDSQFTVYPKLNSKVIIGRIEGEDDCFVVKCSEIEKVVVKIDKVIYQVDKTGFLLKKQNESLKKLMSDLLKAIKLMKFTTNTGVTINLVNLADFVAIENRFNDFLK